MSTNSSSNTGIGFCGLLAVAFIVLKLTNVIAWSWWLVLAPMWAPLALAIAILAVVGIYFLIKFLSKSKR